MKQVSIITSEQAADLIKDNDFVTVNGFLASVQPEALTSALETRFLQTGSPKDLTLYYCAGQGNSDGRGGEHFAHEGLLKRVILGHWGTVPAIAAMANACKMEAYNFPQGTLAQHYRDVAAHRMGTFTNVGLETFVDPRISGGKMNDITKEDLVQLQVINGEEQLFYPRMKMDIAFIRGTFADEWGNIVMTKEISPIDALPQAQAVHNSGGTVIVQVEKVVKGGSLDPKLVIIPGIYVDYVVEAESVLYQQQTFGCEFDPSVCGEISIPVEAIKPAPLNAKKVIARRAAMLLFDMSSEAVINLGIGIPELISSVAAEEGIGDSLTMTVEAGAIGGVPLGGVRFGASINAECYLGQAAQFDFYDGGGLNLACLGLAQCDGQGNVNVGKFGSRIAGCGGFINITQNTKTVVFCGTFTASGLKEEITNGELHIVQEGNVKKFLGSIDQITFSGNYARKHGQKIMYITERAVFEIKEDGIHLTEIAPGIDLQKDVLEQMEFIPIVKEIKYMPDSLFRNKRIGLKEMRKQKG
ncbi:MAG: 3-oxoacid CoA-transferase [Megasphaera sp.]|jgi:propionate CoA-transferase|uniref:acyl CoA:acetate/3-ketoacid CoA transferase n=1 Tax=Megasphaera sueciensis TaxID=349094 RepID=UPI003D014E5F|nr:3-oxoacid CoA-transferase [Megasphaera sp.]MCI1823838.1 3-oxoacid CoA-transferase [Megasphaera sp.]